MPHDLRSARQFANTYRYSGDIALETYNKSNSTENVVKKRLSSNGLYVSEALTPLLYECLQTACANLRTPIECVSAFVTASSDLQAQCFRTDNNNCIISISSSLVNLLHPDEITFVLGHEVGHHIFKHNQEICIDNSIESMMNQRAKEISVDRAGIIACQSLDTALRASMKVISGLPDQYIRFDTSNFINQIKAEEPETRVLSESLETHPSLIIRARALLWFSMNNNIKVGDTLGSLPLKKIDQWVTRDMNKYVDNPGRKKIICVENDLAFWLQLKFASKNGILTKESRKELIDSFGEENIVKFLAAIDGLNVNEVEEFLETKISETKQQLMSLTPISVAKRISDIENRIKNK